ncbi:RHS repeat-associated core domain-containing protein [Myxococcota bacterium]|nr:RHS repeat-associated core domain-containing protein [Myxococcota bacterium]
MNDQRAARGREARRQARALMPAEDRDPRCTFLRDGAEAYAADMTACDAADEGYTPSASKGETRILPDAAGTPLRSGRSGGHRLRPLHGAARRPAGLVFDAAAGVGQVRSSIFGDTLMDERPKTAGGNEARRKRYGSGVLQEERQTLHVLDDQRRAAMIETLTVTGGSAVSTPTPRFRYQLDDQLGSALLEVDDDGGVIRYEEYHPYGTTAWWAEDAAIELSRKRHRYTGKERDEETGLQVHSARTYAPWLGRWDRPDPIGLRDGGNRWGYGGGRPLASVDPSGTADFPVEGDYFNPYNTLGSITVYRDEAPGPHPANAMSWTEYQRREQSTKPLERESYTGALLSPFEALIEDVNAVQSEFNDLVAPAVNPGGAAISFGAGMAYDYFLSACPEQYQEAVEFANNALNSDLYLAAEDLPALWLAGKAAKTASTVVIADTAELLTDASRHLDSALSRGALTPDGRLVPIPDRPNPNRAPDAPKSPDANFMAGYGKPLDAIVEDKSGNFFPGIRYSMGTVLGLKSVKGGLTVQPVTNPANSEALRKQIPGAWEKVYQDGYNMAGERVSVHYYRHTDTKQVSAVKTVGGWSNKSEQ